MKNLILSIGFVVFFFIILSFESQFFNLNLERQKANLVCREAVVISRLNLGKSREELNIILRDKFKGDDEVKKIELKGNNKLELCYGNIEISKKISC